MPSFTFPFLKKKMMNKFELRKKYKKMRLALPEEEIEDQSLKIANHTLKLPIWEFQYYHLFLSIAEQKEVNTEYLLHILQGKDKEVVVSRTDIQHHRLHHYLLTDATRIQKNRWNIPEPQGGIEVPQKILEVVFIPLLAFDLTGHRIGYGKGFYDNFLRTCKPGTVKIGLSFFEAEDHIKEIYESDVALDYCITPSNIYAFKS